MKKPNLKKLDAKISKRAVYFRNRRFSIMELLTENFMTFLSTFESRKEVETYFSEASGDEGVPRLLKPLAEIWTRNSIMELIVDRGVDDQSVEESKTVMQSILEIVSIKVPDDVKQDLESASLDHQTESFFEDPLVAKLNSVGYFTESLPEFKRETFVEMLARHLKMLMKLANLQFSFESLANERPKIEEKGASFTRREEPPYYSSDDLSTYFYYLYFFDPSDDVESAFYDNEGEFKNARVR